VRSAMEKVYKDKEIGWKSYVSAIAAEGVKILS